MEAYVFRSPARHPRNLVNGTSGRPNEELDGWRQCLLFNLSEIENNYSELKNNSTELKNNSDEIKNNSSAIKNNS